MFNNFYWCGSFRALQYVVIHLISAHQTMTQCACYQVFWIKQCITVNKYMFLLLITLVVFLCPLFSCLTIYSETIRVQRITWTKQTTTAGVVFASTFKHTYVICSLTHLKYVRPTYVIAYHPCAKIFDLGSKTKSNKLLVKMPT